MSDNTIIAVVIVVAVVVFAVVMIVMLCQKSKAEAEIKLNARRRQQRRNSRMIGRAFSHKYFNPFGEAKSPPENSHNTSQSHNNGDNNGENNGDNTVSNHVEVVDESPVFVVDNVLESRGTLGNVSDPSDRRHPNSIARTDPFPRSHNTVTHTLQVPTLPDCPPLSTSGQLERYDYVPHPLPPIDAAPIQMQYTSPNESRGNEQE